MIENKKLQRTQQRTRWNPQKRFHRALEVLPHGSASGKRQLTGVHRKIDMLPHS
jgi:hypothetical protein